MWHKVSLNTFSVASCLIMPQLIVLALGLRRLELRYSMESSADCSIPGGVLPEAESKHARMKVSRGADLI